MPPKRSEQAKHMFEIKKRVDNHYEGSKMPKPKGYGLFDQVEKDMQYMVTAKDFLRSTLQLEEDELKKHAVPIITTQERIISLLIK